MADQSSLAAFLALPSSFATDAVPQQSSGRGSAVGGNAPLVVQREGGGVVTVVGGIDHFNLLSVRRRVVQGRPPTFLQQQQQQQLIQQQQQQQQRRRSLDPTLSLEALQGVVQRQREGVLKALKSVAVAQQKVRPPPALPVAQYKCRNVQRCGARGSAVARGVRRSRVPSVDCCGCANCPTVAGFRRRCRIAALVLSCGGSALHCAL